MSLEFDEDDRKTWLTRDGRILLIINMEDTHLVNTIRYLEKTAPARMTALAMNMLSYAADAPDGAADCAEAGAMELADMPVEEFLANDRKYQALLKEAKRRKLKFQHFQMTRERELDQVAHVFLEHIEGAHR